MVFSIRKLSDHKFNHSSCNCLMNTENDHNFTCSVGLYMISVMYLYYISKALSGS